jgi:hypothetical protein
MAHICNPGNLGGRDQEDQSLKPVWANSSLSRKYPTQNRAGGVAQVVQCMSRKSESPSSNPSTPPAKFL